MSILTSIRQKLGLAKVAAPAPVKASGDFRTQNNLSDLIMPWVRANQRKKLEEDLVNMDENCPIVARMLDRTADAATVYDNDDGLPLGFKVVTGEAKGETPTKEQEKAVGIVNDMLKNVNLQGQSSWDTTREMVRKGNVFAEVVLDPDEGRVAAVKQFPNSWQLVKNVDNSGNLKTMNPKVAMEDPKLSFEAAYTQVDDGNKALAAFFPYQINHWTFGPLGGKLYAEPVGASGVKTYKRFEAGIDSLGVARIVRAWDTNIHIIPMPAGLTPDEVGDKIREYQEINEQDTYTTYDSSSGNFQMTNRNSPMHVDRDHYIPNFYTQDGKSISGDIKKSLPSTAALQHLEDLEMQINLLVCLYGVPVELLMLDIGKKPMVDKTKEEGMEAWAKYIRRLQYSHAVGLKTIFDLELLLNGINPMQDLYKITYPAVTPRTKESEAKINMTNSQAALYQWQMSMPPELVGPGLDLDARQIEQWKQNVIAQAALAKAAKPNTGVEPAKPKGK